MQDHVFPGILRALVGLLQTLLILSPSLNAAEQPNFVFILADDLGWADVSFHGGQTPTPNLDRLAVSSLELERHYVAPVCSPTRTGLLTGRYWSRFGVTTPTNTQALPTDTLTLPRALETCGYESCLIGKWHLGSKSQWGPNLFGFQHSYGSLAGGISPWNHRYKKGPYSETWHRNGHLIEEDGHVTDLLTREAINWIEHRGDRPFFLYIPYTAVHLPLKEPRKWLNRVPASVRGDVARHYAASIMHLDDAVGRIRSALEKAALFDRTMLVFTSDNGGSTAENNDLRYPDDNCPNGRLPGDNQPLRGKKGDVYEGGIRVPTLVSWPGKIRPGTNATPVQITDWMPTFCSMAGYKTAAKHHWDGLDLSRLLLKNSSMTDRAIYTAGPAWRSLALHFRGWKLVVLGKPPNRKHELFHVAVDQEERHDLADEHPQRLSEMLLQLEKVSASDRDAMLVPP